MTDTDDTGGTDPVTAPDTDPAYAQGDQDAEPPLTAPPTDRPDAAVDADQDGPEANAGPPDAEGAG
jgi:hypothetical protein